MKKSLLSVFSVFLAVAMNAQANCEADYNFGDEPFGVSPDPAIGESFNDGEVGVAYFQVIHIKVPVDASEIEIEGVTLPPGVAIDSIRFESVTFELAGTGYTAAQMGLEVQCNNNGDTPNPCTFLGGSQYCATLSGVPTTPGLFDLAINVTGFVTVFGNVTGIPVSFDQYTYFVDGEVNVPTTQVYNLNLGQNFPNPASEVTRVPLSLEKAGSVNFTVVNLLGEILVREQYSGNAGHNEFVADVSMLSPGIYLYSVDVDGKRITKRMIINR